MWQEDVSVAIVVWVPQHCVALSCAKRKTRLRRASCQQRLGMLGGGVFESSPSDFLCPSLQMTAAKRKEEQKAKELGKKEDQKTKRARIDVKKDTVRARRMAALSLAVGWRA